MIHVLLKMFAKSRSRDFSRELLKQIVQKENKLKMTIPENYSITCCSNKQAVNKRAGSTQVGSVSTLTGDTLILNSFL